MGKECMARLSRRLWGGTSLKTAAKEAMSTVSSLYYYSHTPYSKMATDLCAYKLALVASFKIKYSFEF